MKTVYSGGEAEIVEKKSRFIATVRPVSSEEEAVSDNRLTGMHEIHKKTGIHEKLTGLMRYTHKNFKA